MIRLNTFLILTIALSTMAPGYGRPSYQIQVDRLIEQYEDLMEPHEGMKVMQVGEAKVWIDEANDHYVSYFPRFGSGGAVRVSSNGIHIHSSLYKDGSVLWSFVHPDGRVFSRKTFANGEQEYFKK